MQAAQDNQAVDPGQLLKDRVPALMRTRSHLKSIPVEVCYDPEKKVIEIYYQAADDTPSAREQNVPLSAITTVKVKDFTSASGEEHYVWSLTRKVLEMEQLSFEFHSREQRDRWGYAMRTLVNESGVVALSAGGADATGGMNRRGRTIKHIDPDKPEFGYLVHLRVDFADGATAFLSVRDDQTSTQETKRVVTQFIQDNVVLEAEQHSLTRYVRSMVERVHLERDTQKIVDEINALHLEEVAHKANVNLNNAIHMNQMRENARKQLTELADSLEERLGKRGPGATIVTLILKRNVEKMKLINEVFQKAAQAGVAPGQGQHGDMHSTNQGMHAVPHSHSIP